MAHRGNPHSLPSGTDSGVGREPELAEIDEFLTQTSPPAALVLAGPAGIGKTTLWQAGVAAAREAAHLGWSRVPSKATPPPRSPGSRICSKGLSMRSPTSFPAPGAGS